MVQLRGSSSFMMGSTPKQIEEATALCRQQADARATKDSARKDDDKCSDDSFAMEGPRHPVKIGEYWVDKQPAQVDSFVEFLNQQGPDLSVRNDSDSHQPRFVHFKEWALFDLYDKEKSGVLYDAKTKRFSVKQGFAKHAIKYVSWYGAWVYCSDKGKRLLTEAEYEYAAFHNQGATRASSDLELPGPTAEWVYDSLEGTYPSCRDAPCSGGETDHQTIENIPSRVVRGCAPDELPVRCRINARTGSKSAQGFFNITFRCALTSR